MANEPLTHWKKLTNPNYIGAYTLDPGQDMILTIRNCIRETVTGEAGKKEECTILYFMEAGIKPMILNKTNAKTIAKIHGTPYIQQWAGKQIQIYSKQVDAFGTTTDALRVRDFVPQSKQLDITDALFKLESCETVDELKDVFLKLSKAEQSHKDVKARTEELKEALTAKATQL